MPTHLEFLYLLVLLAFRRLGSFVALKVRLVDRQVITHRKRGIRRTRTIRELVVNKFERAFISLVGVLSVLGIAATINFLINGGGNEGFAEYPTLTNLHVIPGIVYIALAPLQFLSPIRQRYPKLHRWSGRLLATIGLMLGVAGLFIALIFPYSGVAEQIVVGGFAVFFLFSIVKGFQCAWVKQFAKHREWMMRAFAIGLSIVTMRLIFISILAAINEPAHADAELYSIVSFTMAFFVHSLGAELWIRHTRHNSRTATDTMVATG